MYVALSLLLLMLVSLVNLYCGFATTVYLCCGSQAGTFPEYAQFLWRREAFAALARVEPAPPAIDDPPPVPDLETPVEQDATDDEPERRRPPVDSFPQDEIGEHPVTTVLARSTIELRDMIGELTQLDRRLRHASAAPVGEELQACAVALNEAVHRRLEHLRQSLAPLELYESQHGAFVAQRAALDALVGSLSAELHAILADLVGLNFGLADPRAAAAPLAAADEKVCGVCHVYRDLLLDALTALVGSEVGYADVDRHLRSDEQTGLAGRIGLETAVLDLRASGAGEEDAVVLIDIDRLGVINRERGADVGDRVLGAVARLLGQVRDRQWLAARVAGQQCALLCAGARLHDAAEAAERLRQSIEKTSFLGAGERLRVTVSAAVVELRPHDSVDSMLERAAAAVREAKSYGRNRTFIYDDDYPTPVVPPELAIAPQEMKL